ncbi:MAG: fibronectin type III domain-containing protein, partial [Gammaproteobacteria bacterium]|nr:fibronectin type III domain-containing protein [Gammaproteobacteria bacterium]
RDGGARITGYRIEVSEDGGVRWDDLVADTRHTRTTHVHRGLEPAPGRHARVAAINRIGEGGASRAVSAITDATVPDAPTGLVATDVSPTRIDLFWAAPAYDGGAPVTGYRVEVSEDGAAWTDLVANTGSRATTYPHTGLLPGSRRHYRVSAINLAGTGAASVSASAETDDPVGRAGRLNTRVLPHVAAAMTSSTVSAIARRVDAVANGTGMQRRVETNGLSSMAASLSAPDAGGLGLAQGDQAGLVALFGGTSFTMPFGDSDAQQQLATGMQLGSWGAGEYHHLGEPGASALDWKGNMVSGHVGVDARIGPDILAGVAGSYSSGSFDFTDKTGASPVRGTYGTTMTSVHPYMAWFSGAGGASVWGSAGLGRGDIEVDDEREGLRTSPASTLTGAGGASYRLLTRGAGGVSLKAEGWGGQIKVEGAEQIEAVTLQMQRAKLALELTQGFSTNNGNEMAFVLEGGMRYDDGDGVNGTSAEVGGGLRYTNPGLGLTAEGRGRFVISARNGYEEWGLGGMLMFDPAARGQGLSLRVAPSYGVHASGVNQLWERGVSDAVGGHGLGMGPNVDGEVAYGIAGFQGTPYSGFYLGQGGTRAFSSGVRYDMGSGVGLRLEGTRRESGLAGAQHSVGIRGRIKLR